jgi:hypothetical protein
MKACRSCRHYFEPWGSVCEHPSLVKDDPIYGTVGAYPRTEREAGKPCGPEAKLWQPNVPHVGHDLWGWIAGGAVLALLLVFVFGRAS